MSKSNYSIRFSKWETKRESSKRQVFYEVIFLYWQYLVLIEDCFFLSQSLLLQDIIDERRLTPIGRVLVQSGGGGCRSKRTAGRGQSTQTIDHILLRTLFIQLFKCCAKSCVFGREEGSGEMEGKIIRNKMCADKSKLQKFCALFKYMQKSIGIIQNVWWVLCFFK